MGGLCPSWQALEKEDAAELGSGLEVEVERASQGRGGLVVTVSCLGAWAQVGGERGHGLRGWRIILWVFFFHCSDFQAVFCRALRFPEIHRGSRGVNDSGVPHPCLNQKKKNKPFLVFIFVFDKLNLRTRVQRKS